MAVAKITGERGWRVETKLSLRRFLADKKIASSWTKCVSGHQVIARATSYCLLPDTFRLRVSKNAFKVGSVKFADSLSPPSIVKKVRAESKSSQGRDLSDAGQKSRELTTLPESPKSF